MQGSNELRVTGNSGAASDATSSKRQRRTRAEKKLPLVARFQEKNLRNVSQVVIPCSLKNQYCRNGHLEAIIQTAKTKYLHDVHIVIMLNDVIYSLNELFSKANPNPQAIHAGLYKLAHSDGDITREELALIRKLAEGEPTLHAHEAGNDWLTTNQAIFNEYLKGHPVDRFEDIIRLPSFAPTVAQITDLYFSDAKFKEAYDASILKRLVTVKADHAKAGRVFHERLFRACSLAYLIYECAGFVAYTLTHKKEDFLHHEQIFEALRVTREHFILPKYPTLLRWHQIEFVNEETELNNQASTPAALQLKLPAAYNLPTISSPAYAPLFLPPTTTLHPEYKSSSTQSQAATSAAHATTATSPRVQLEATLVIGLLIKVIAPKVQEELRPIVSEMSPELTTTIINGVLTQLHELFLPPVAKHPTSILQAAQPEEHASKLKEPQQVPVVTPTPTRGSFIHAGPPLTGSPLRRRLTAGDHQRPASSPPTLGYLNQQIN